MSKYEVRDYIGLWTYNFNTEDEAREAIHTHANSLGYTFHMEAYFRGDSFLCFYDELGRTMTYIISKC